MARVTPPAVVKTSPTLPQQTKIGLGFMFLWSWHWVVWHGCSWPCCPPLLMGIVLLLHLRNVMNGTKGIVANIHVSRGCLSLLTCPHSSCPTVSHGDTLHVLVVVCNMHFCVFWLLFPKEKRCCVHNFMFWSLRTWVDNLVPCSLNPKSKIIDAVAMFICLQMTCNKQSFICPLPSRFAVVELSARHDIKSYKDRQPPVTAAAENRNHPSHETYLHLPMLLTMCFLWNIFAKCVCRPLELRLDTEQRKQLHRACFPCEMKMSTNSCLDLSRCIPFFVLLRRKNVWTLKAQKQTSWGLSSQLFDCADAALAGAATASKFHGCNKDLRRPWGQPKVILMTKVSQTCSLFHQEPVNTTSGCSWCPFKNKTVLWFETGFCASTTLWNMWTRFTVQCDLFFSPGARKNNLFSSKMYLSHRHLNFSCQEKDVEMKKTAVGHAALSSFDELLFSLFWRCPCLPCCLSLPLSQLGKTISWYPGENKNEAFLFLNVSCHSKSLFKLGGSEWDFPASCDEVDIVHKASKLKCVFLTVLYLTQL